MTPDSRMRLHAAANEQQDQPAMQAQGAEAPACSIGNTSPYLVKKTGLFEDLSLAQIIAGAAAAATSVMLASQIGIAGSVIGAAVSSVVTVISSQIYRKFITASAEKLKHAYTTDTGTGNDIAGSAASAQAPGAAREQATPSPMGWEQQARFEQDANGQMRAAQPAYPGARIAPERLRARAKAERTAMQRKVTVFSIAAAVVAVVFCVAIILITTSGQGLGQKTEPLFVPIATNEHNTSDTEEAPPEDEGIVESGEDGQTQPSTPGENTPSDEVDEVLPETPSEEVKPGDESAPDSGDTSTKPSEGTGSAPEGGTSGNEAQAAA